MPLPTGLSNGLIPLVMLEPLPWWEADHLYLEGNAARSLGRVAGLFLTEFGRPLLVTDAYRPLDVQVRLKIQKGSYAATPGRSEHGWARAVDLASRINVDTSAEHKWMERVGPEHGWHNPPWATDRDPKNGQYEPWHWEYDDETDQHIDDPDEDEDDMKEEDWARLSDLIDARLRAEVGHIVEHHPLKAAKGESLGGTLASIRPEVAGIPRAIVFDVAMGGRSLDEWMRSLSNDFLTSEGVTRAQLTEALDLIRTLTKKNGA